MAILAEFIPINLIKRDEMSLSVVIFQFCIVFRMNLSHLISNMAKWEISVSI
jgi:hypothetical protein